MGKVERPIRAKVIAGLGDRQGDDVDVRVREGGQDLSRVLRREEDALQDANDPHAVAQGLDRIEPVLRRQGLAQRRRAEGNAGDAPFTAGRLDSVFGEDVLVRAMKGAGAQVQNSGPQSLAVVAGTGNGRRQA
jgi:hypothetical protein